MPNSSLTTLPLSSNDISSLAQIFDITLQYYCHHNSPFEDDYMRKLSIIMGLGFTTVLVDGSLLTVYEPYLHTFIRYRNFKAHRAFISTLSHAIAEMISGTVFLFRFLKRPQYYDMFLRVVQNVATHITIQEAGKKKDAERLIKILFQTHY